MPGEGAQLRLWLIVKRSLQAKDGQRYFENNIKFSLFTGWSGRRSVLQRHRHFPSKPANNPEAVILGLSDTHTPEVTVRFVDQHGKVPILENLSQ